MKKVVKSVNFDRPIESQWGSFFKYIIEFEDGLKAEYLSKSENQNKFEVGKDVEVEITQREYSGQTINKVKPVFQSNRTNFTPSTMKNDNREKFIIKQTSLKCATDYVIANGGDSAKVIELAEMFTQWVLNDVKPTNDIKNDLPF